MDSLMKVIDVVYEYRFTTSHLAIKSALCEASERQLESHFAYHDQVMWLECDKMLSNTPV